MTDDEVISREERCFRLWINSLGILTYVNNLFEDVRNGLVSKLYETCLRDYMWFMESSLYFSGTIFMICVLGFHVLASVMLPCFTY